MPGKDSVQSTGQTKNLFSRCIKEVSRDIWEDFCRLASPWAEPYCVEDEEWKTGRWGWGVVCLHLPRCVKGTENISLGLWRPVHTLLSAALMMSYMVKKQCPNLMVCPLRLEGRTMPSGRSLCNRKKIAAQKRTQETAGWAEDPPTVPGKFL